MTIPVDRCIKLFKRLLRRRIFRCMGFEAATTPVPRSEAQLRQWREVGLTPPGPPRALFSPERARQLGIAGSHSRDDCARLGCQDAVMAPFRNLIKKLRELEGGLVVNDNGVSTLKTIWWSANPALRQELEQVLLVLGATTVDLSEAGLRNPPGLN